ncbi:glycosyltransferase [Paraclostridium bifermentans]|uniref:glycosyltransferase n=1 Tax=Paraclostridium bifermentans TaxID=1490 RepID=UPI00374F64BC
MKKSILIIQESLDGGGAERVLINILNKIDYTKYRVDLLLLFEEGVYLKNVPEAVNVKRVWKRTDNGVIKKYVRKVKRTIIRFCPKIIYKLFVKDKYDVEIAFVEGLSTIVLANSTNNKSKKISWVHIDLKKHRTMSIKKESKCYNKIDNIVCVSNDSKRVFDELHNSHRFKSTVVYNMINKKEIEALSNEDVSYNFDTPTVVAVGRLTDQKRFDILIEAHKKLIDEGIVHNLLILGTGPNKNELTKLINKFGLKDTVKLLGFIENPYPYIKNATVYAMSSDFEGLPLVISEALVLGKAIVSTKCTGPNELLEGGEYGIVCEIGDVEGLKNGMKKLLIDDELRIEMGKKSLIRSEIFNEGIVLSEIQKLMEK